MNTIFVMAAVIAVGMLAIACTTPSSPPEQAVHGGAGNPATQKPPDSDGVTAEAPQQPDPHFRILKEGRHKHENWLELNEYFLIHYLYSDIFYASACTNSSA